MKANTVMPSPINRTELLKRMRAFGGGSARATLSLIDRALARHAGPGYRASVPQSATEPATKPATKTTDPAAESAEQTLDPAAETVQLRRASASGLVQLARKLEFEGEPMGRMFTADTDCAAAFLFAAALAGGSGPGVGGASAWAEVLSEAHASALWHLRSQFWSRQGTRLCTGMSMDEVLQSADDPTQEGTFRNHRTRLCARLRMMAARHIPSPAPARVRWGYVAGRLPAGHWPQSHENSDVFMELVELIASERGFAHSFEKARTSVAQNYVVPVTDFGPNMSIAELLSERDLREIHEALPHSVDEFVIATAALRALISKSIWTGALDKAKDVVVIEVFRDGGWYPAESAETVAKHLVTSTIADLDIVRVLGGWLAKSFTACFVASTHAQLQDIVSRVAAMLLGGTFFAALSRSSRRSYAQTVDPLATIGALPSKSRAKVPAQDRVLQNRDRSESGDGDARGGSVDLPATRVLHVYTDEEEDYVDGAGDPSTVMFVEEGVENAPPLEVRDAHEDMTPAGGATCFELDASTSTWRMFAHQDRGAIHITSVHSYLGYRGFGRSTFLVEAYGPNGHLHASNVVAVVSYDRSRLEARVASAMDTMEGLPAAFGRLNRSVYAPYLVRDLVMSPRTQRLATDHVTSFPAAMSDAPPLGMAVVSHARDGGVFDYETSSGRNLRVPCEGWGADSSAHVRSVVRAFWIQDVGASCPHDMCMRLTRSTTHVLFNDEEGRAASRRYNLDPHTVLNVWDGHVTIAEERSDSIVYVLDNDLADCRYRLAIVAGHLLGSPDLPDSTARMIEAHWRLLGQTSPHASTDTIVGPSGRHQRSSTPLVEPVVHDARTAPAWLRTEARRVFSRT